MRGCSSSNEKILKHHCRTLVTKTNNVDVVNNVIEDVDVVVVGAGLLGSSVAYHLSKMKDRRVLVVDKNQPASCATSQSVGLLVHVSADPHKTRFVQETRRDLEDLNLFEHDFKATGTVRVAVSEGNKRKLLEEIQVANSCGVRNERLNVQDARHLVPWLSIDESDDALIYFMPDDGWIDPQILAGSYLRAARECENVRTMCGNDEHEVVELLLDSSKITSVKLKSGETIKTKAVVDATGSWGGLLLEKNKSSSFHGLAHAPTRSHYWIVGGCTEKFPSHCPNVVLPDVAAYTRSQTDGSFVLGVQEGPSDDADDDTTTYTWDPRQLPIDGREQSDLAEADSDQAQLVLLNRFEELATYMPEIESAELQHWVAGMSTYTFDGKYNVGAHTSTERMYVASGCNGSGLSASGGIGKFIAGLVDRTAFITDDDWTSILDRERKDDPRIDLYDPERQCKDQVDDGSVFSETFRERCAMSRVRKFQSE